MNYYVEIKIKDNVTADSAFVFRKVFGYIHEILTKRKTAANESAIGIAFPEYTSRGLGKTIRLFGSRDDLINFSRPLRSGSKFWKPFAVLSPLRPTPEKTEYVSFGRRQFRRGMSKEKQTQKRSLPYVIVQSASSAQSYSMFIEKLPSKKYEHCAFNCYGLAKNNQTSVPDF